MRRQGNRSLLFFQQHLSLLCKISSNFKVPGGLHITNKMFGLAKLLKNFLDAHYLSLVEYAEEFQDVWCDLSSARVVGVSTSQQQFIVLPYGRTEFGKR